VTALRVDRLCAALLAVAIAHAVCAPQAARCETEAQIDAQESPLSAAMQKLFDGGEDSAPLEQANRDYFESLPAAGKAAVEQAVDDEWVTSSEHLGALLSLRLPTDRLEGLMTDACFLCHTDPESQTEETLLSRDAASEHMRLDNLVADSHVRRGLGCAGCHGGDPAEMDHDFPDEWPTSAKQRHEDRRWVAPFCGRCHSDVNFMRAFNPQLPTDQYSKYIESRHGKALTDDPKSGAAECTSCHSVHGILSPRDPRSPVHAKNVPAMCAHCHADKQRMAGVLGRDGKPLPTDQYEQYVSSVHGRKLLEEGETVAPACNDCHGSHASAPAETLSVSQSCRGCHSGIGRLYDGSVHKAVFEKNGWAECGACHGEHAISEAGDSMLGAGPGSVCAGCHAQYATENPVCKQTADYFHEQLTMLSSRYENAMRSEERIAHKGLDNGPLSIELEALADGLREARTVIHAFDRVRFDETTLPPRQSAGRIDELVADAEAELAWRTRGLVLSLVITGLLLVLIRLKLARVERQ